MDILKALFNQSAHQLAIISESVQKFIGIDQESDKYNKPISQRQIALQKQTLEYDFNAINGATEYFDWCWKEKGILQINANVANYQNEIQSVDTALVISVGIHGNETAPIEIVHNLILALFTNPKNIHANVLIILGNPAAILSGKRYLHSDMNRMFSGRISQFAQSIETERVTLLEQKVKDFFAEQPSSFHRLHLDIHTAIRASHYPRFTLLPFQTSSYHPVLQKLFIAANLDAVVFHQQVGGTFSQFTQTECHATSCTLELGKALPFGENNLQAFSAIESSLCALIYSGVTGLIALAEQCTLCKEPFDKQSSDKQTFDKQIVYFEVKKSLVKHTEEKFKLYVDASCPNFERFSQGFLLLQQGSISEETFDEYKVEDESEWILFPNPTVALGLRAGMVLRKLSIENVEAKFD